MRNSILACPSQGSGGRLKARLPPLLIPSWVSHGEGSVWQLQSSSAVHHLPSPSSNVITPDVAMSEWSEVTRLSSWICSLPGHEVSTWGGFSCLAWFRLTTNTDPGGGRLAQLMPSLPPSFLGSSHCPHPLFLSLLCFHRNSGRRPWDTARTSRQCQGVELAAKLAMWKVSWLTEVQPLTRLGLAALP